jgi:hypothetical protein
MQRRVIHPDSQTQQPAHSTGDNLSYLKVHVFAQAFVSPEGFIDKIFAKH